MPVFNRMHFRMDHEWVGDAIVYHTEFDGYQVVDGGAEVGLFSDDGTPVDQTKTYDATPIEANVEAPAWAAERFG